MKKIISLVFLLLLLVGCVEKRSYIEEVNLEVLTNTSSKNINVKVIVSGVFLDTSVFSIKVVCQTQSCFDNVIDSSSVPYENPKTINFDNGVAEIVEFDPNKNTLIFNILDPREKIIFRVYVYDPFIKEWISSPPHTLNFSNG